MTPVCWLSSGNGLGCVKNILKISKNIDIDLISWKFSHFIQWTCLYKYRGYDCSTWKKPEPELHLFLQVFNCRRSFVLQSESGFLWTNPGSFWSWLISGNIVSRCKKTFSLNRSFSQQLRQKLSPKSTKGLFQDIFQLPFRSLITRKPLYLACFSSH